MTIQEFSKRIGASPHTIRYYEKIGLLNKVKRTTGGHRWFDERDILWFDFIIRLKETGMPLEEILCYARLRMEGKSTLPDRRHLLERHAKSLAQEITKLQNHQLKLLEKIEYYRKESSHIS